MKYNKLFGKIVEVYGTRKAFAEAIDDAQQTIANKLNGNVKFYADDIEKYCKALDIPASDIPAYFFGKEVK